MHEINKDKKQ